MHFKIIYESSAALFIILAIWSCVPMLLFAVNALFVRSRKLNLAATILGVIAIFEHVFLLAYALSKLYYLVCEAGPYLAVAGFVAIILTLIFLPRFKRQKAVRFTLIAVLCVAFLFVTLFGLFDLRPFYLNTGATVFAVEDEYQIAFGTSKNSIGGVKIGDQVFYDAVGGSNIVSTVHKISVPRALLDEQKSYTVFSQSVIHNRAYLSVSGGSAQRSYTFRPADDSDGLQAFNFSDNHLLKSGVESAVSKLGAGLDVIVANGDLFNDVSYEFQITLVYQLLGKISGGSIPIVMTRGNHESVGAKLADLPSYIASRDGNFYYTVRFGDVLFYVLDMSNDMSDGNIMIRPTANFDEYRAAELKWLKAQNDASAHEADGIKRTIAFCHIPFAMEHYVRRYGEFIGDMVRETERVGIEALIGGHEHKTYVLDADSESNLANYPCVVGGKRSDALEVNETIFASRYTGTLLNITADGVTLKFVNSKGEILLEQNLI